MSEFRFRTPLRVRFAETDAGGIVYHANYLVYFETARMEYLRVVLGNGPGETRSLSELGGFPMFLAEALVKFESPTRFDELLDIGVRIAHVGRTSLRMEYELRRVTTPGAWDTGVPVARGHTVQVAVDMTTGKPTPLPEPARSRFVAFDAPTV